MSVSTDILSKSPKSKSIEKERTNGDFFEVEVTSPESSSLDVDLVTTEEGFESLKQDWDKLVNRPEVDTHVFQTFDWQKLWWKYFGADNKLQILTVWKNDDLVGIAPFFIDTISFFGLYDYKKLKFIGSSIPNTDAVGGFTSYSISDYLDIIVHPDFSKPFVDVFLNYLDKNRSLVDQIKLNELSENGTFINLVLPELWQRGWKFKSKAKEVCPQIQLPDTIEEYLDGLHRKSRYNLRYSKRAVIEKGLFKVYQVKNKDELDSAFEKFVSIHQKRWNKRGYPGIFVNNEYQNFLKDIGEAFDEKDLLRMSTAIDNNGQCIAVNFAFKFKNRIYDYQKAFDDESDLAKYSPGRALTYFLIEDAISGKCKCVDLLRGGEKYKLRFTNHKTRNWLMTIPGLSKRNSLKSFLYNLVQKSVDLKEFLRREQLLLKVHIKQWGISGFIPHYSVFLKDRLKEKF